MTQTKMKKKCIYLLQKLTKKKKWKIYKNTSKTTLTFSHSFHTIQEMKSSLNFHLFQGTLPEKYLKRKTGNDYKEEEKFHLP